MFLVCLDDLIMSLYHTQYLLILINLIQMLKSIDDRALFADDRKHTCVHSSIIILLTDWKKGVPVL